jgi:hypothetical protein
MSGIIAVTKPMVLMRQAVRSHGPFLRKRSAVNVESPLSELYDHLWSAKPLGEGRQG